jgi:hypothetical protein
MEALIRPILCLLLQRRYACVLCSSSSCMPGIFTTNPLLDSLAAGENKFHNRHRMRPESGRKLLLLLLLLLLMMMMMLSNHS